MNGRLATAIQMEREVPVTLDASIEMPVTPPSMKLLESRKPCRPIPADRMPSTTRNALRNSRRTRFTLSSYATRLCRPFVDARAQRGELRSDLAQFLLGGPQFLSFRADEPAVRCDALADPFAAFADLLRELRVERFGQTLADVADFLAHLFFRLFALGRQDEEPQRGQDRRHDQPGYIGGGGGCRNRDDRAQSHGTRTYGGRGRDGVAGAVRELACFLPAIERIDHFL